MKQKSLSKNVISKLPHLFSKDLTPNNKHKLQKNSNHKNSNDNNNHNNNKNSHFFTTKVFGTTSLSKRLKFQYLKKIFKQSLNATEKVFDAGCKDGHYSFYLIKNYPNIEVLGLDVEKEHISKCHSIKDELKFNNIDFQVGDLVKYSKKEHYNKILALDITHYVGDKDGIIFDNFYNSLKKGGTLLLSIPNISAVYKYYKDEPCKYTRTEMMKMLVKAGFKEPHFVQIGSNMYNKLNVRAQKFAKKEGIIYDLYSFLLLTISIVVIKLDKFLSKKYHESWLIIAKK